MKKNKSFLLVAVLVVLIGVFAIVKFTSNSGRSKSFKEELVTIDEEAVTKVEILTPTDTTLLEEATEGWTVNQTKVGEELTIQTMLKTLQTIKPSRLASRSEDSWKDFQVDESGTRVIAYEGSDKVLDIILGRFSVEGQRSYYSYVRLKDDEDVYVAKDFMKMSIGTTGADYRNDDILKVNKDSVNSIRFNYPDSAFQLVKADQGWIIEEAAADSASVAKYLQGLNLLTSRKFAEPEVEALFNVVYEMPDGSNVQVAGYPGSGISSTYNVNEYWEDKGVFDKVFKGGSYFIGK